MNGNKSEKPTPKKVRDSRKKGKVARSVDFTGACICCLVALVLVLLAWGFWQVWFDLLGFTLSRGSGAGDELVGSVLSAWCQLLTRSVVCVLVPAFLVGLMVLFIQVGPLWVPVRFDLQRVDLSKGFKQMFKVEKLVNLVTLIVKFAVVMVGSVVGFWWMIKRGWRISNMAGWQGISSLLDCFLAVLLIGVVVLLVAGVFDLWLQRRRWIKDLMMSPREVKQEFKEMEGDPEIKQMRKQLYREFSAGGLGDRVGRASVVVVNPTRYAVALDYDSDSGAVPGVLAKGAFETATEIRRIALLKGVPVVRFPPVARALFVLGVDEQIPPEMYRAVAEILVYVSRILPDRERFRDCEKKSVKKLDKKVMRG